MFFFNGRIRNAHIAPMILRDQPRTLKIGHSYIISSCLSIIIGLALIFIGVTFETKKIVLIGSGIIILTVGFILTTLVCFCAKLKICYDNWAYGRHIIPCNSENSQTILENTMSVTSFIEPSARTKTTVYNSIITPNICKNATGYGNK